MLLGTTFSWLNTGMYAFGSHTLDLIFDRGTEVDRGMQALPIVMAFDPVDDILTGLCSGLVVFHLPGSGTRIAPFDPRRAGA